MLTRFCNSALAKTVRLGWCQGAAAASPLAPPAPLASGLLFPQPCQLHAARAAPHPKHATPRAQATGGGSASAALPPLPPATAPPEQGGEQRQQQIEGSGGEDDAGEQGADYDADAGLFVGWAGGAGASAAADAPLEPGLYVVATPIGNLEDISYRALRVLRGADLVLAEDTRRSGQLLRRFGISPPRLASCHEHNERQRADEALAALRGGAVVALVSDAGLPGVSDPGTALVAAAVGAGITVVPVPGACAATAALVASGLPTFEWHFAGFLPPKKGARLARLRCLQAVPGTLVLYVSPHSLPAVLRDAAEVLGGARRAVLARELTKLHEEFMRTTLAGAVEAYAERKPRGEYVLLIEGGRPGDDEDGPADEAAWRGRLALLMADGVPPSSAAKQVAVELGVPRKQAYTAALQLHNAEQLEQGGGGGSRDEEGA